MGLGFVIFMEFIPVPHQNGGLMCIHMIHKYIYIYTVYIYIYIHIYIHIYIYISVYTSRMSFMVFTNPKNNLGFSGEKHSTIGMVGNLDDWTPPNPVENVTHLLNPGIC